MADMIAFCDAILQSICEFLATPPVFYIFGLFCFGIIVDIFRKLIGNINR